MISDTVLKWAEEFEKVVKENSYQPYNPYPNAFISEREEETN